MQGRKNLRKPANWQDFETLCKKLWGEIWRCPEIKKNGRAGQAQHGVDVHGVPAGEDRYYGIQCKGKDEYVNAVLSEEEVDVEIEKAKQFKPALKKFYFATTANKDAAIEAYVRQRNLDNLAVGLFSVELYCWEDIVDLIDENKGTHDWYVESQNYRSRHSGVLTFENGQTRLECSVPFRKKVKRYFVKTDWHRKMEEAAESKLAIYKLSEGIAAAARINHLFSTASYKPKVNRSFCNFRLKLQNSGTAPLKQYKVLLSFEGDFEKVKEYESEWPTMRTYRDVFVDEEHREGKLIPYQKTLVQDDAVVFDSISIRPFHRDAVVTIHWKLVSEDYKSEGTLTVNLNIDFKTQTERIEVADESKARIEEEIEDYFTDGDDHD